MLSGKTNQYLEDLYEIVVAPTCENTFSSNDLSEMQDPITLVSSKYVQLTNNVTSSNFYVVDLANTATASKDFIQLDYDIDGTTAPVNLYALYEQDLVGTKTYSWLQLATIDTSLNPSGTLLLKNPDNAFGNKEFKSFMFFFPPSITPTGFENVTYSVYSVDDTEIEYETCDSIEVLKRNETFFDRASAQNATTGEAFYIGSTQYTDAYNVDTEYFTIKDPFNIVLPPLKSIKFKNANRDIPFECECDDTTLCDFDKITFYQNCGEVKEVLADFGVYNGAYEFTTKSFTGLNGQIVYPTATQQAVYDLVFNSYSDDFFLELQELIANNVYIKIKGFEYIFRKETFEPAWQNPDLIAQTSIKIIRKNTIKTIKKNCCES